MSVAEIQQLGYDHPDVQLLFAELQQEYIARYGTPDESAVEPGEFAAPGGMFVMAYLDEVPTAMGGWRWFAGSLPDVEAAVEVKRMYVRAAYRGRGLARAVLARLEQSARAAGARWVVLETGTEQPEAIALYASSGYSAVPPFGHYADEPLSIHLGKPLIA